MKIIQINDATLGIIEGQIITQHDLHHEGCTIAPNFRFRLGYTDRANNKTAKLYSSVTSNR